MNEFVSWCRHLLVSFLFHALTSLHPPSFYRNDFSTCTIQSTAPNFLIDKDYSVRPATNSMPVHIMDVRCTGKEMSLLECGYRRNLTHTTHFGDVGVRCIEREKQFLVVHHYT